MSSRRPAVLSVAAPEPEEFTKFKEYENHVIAWAKCLEKGIIDDQTGPNGSGTDSQLPSTQAAVGPAHQSSGDLLWSSLRVPLEPSPYDYATIEQYEAAMLAWRDAVLSCREPLPPSPHSLRGLRCFEPAARHIQKDAAAAQAQAGATKAPPIPPRHRHKPRHPLAGSVRREIQVRRAPPSQGSCAR